MTPEIQKLMADERIGVVVEAFLAGEAGQALTAKAEEERQAALERLATIDPEDARAIRAVQTEIAVIDRMLSGMVDLMQAARVAQDRLEQLAQGD